MNILSFHENYLFLQTESNKVSLKENLTRGSREENQVRFK